MKLLEGKVALVMGVANADSIAAGCARTFAEAGAEVILTYHNERAKPYVLPVARSVGAKQVLPLDVETPGQMEEVFDAVRDHWGRLDILVHSIAFCPGHDLHGRVTDCSASGFAQAMDVSVHSLIRMARLAEPLMAGGGTILTMTYYGGEKVVDHYNIMGPVKAALEGTMRALAVELGPKQICDNAISPVAATAKGIVSDVAGIADILVVPDLEAANMMANQLIYLAGADAAGIVLGARVPIILTSRADSTVSRLASCALAQLFIGHHARSPI